jgi:hypothetical protein
MWRGLQFIGRGGWMWDNSSNREYSIKVDGKKEFDFLI